MAALPTPGDGRFITRAARVVRKADGSLRDVRRWLGQDTGNGVHYFRGPPPPASECVNQQAVRSAREQKRNKAV